MSVDDVANESEPTRSRSSDPMHTVITPPTVDLRSSADSADLGALHAEIARLSQRVAALEADREHTRRSGASTTHSAPSHTTGSPTIRRRTRSERQSGWQPAKR